MAERDQKEKLRADETSAIDGPWADPSPSDAMPTAGGDDDSMPPTLLTGTWQLNFGMLRPGDRVPGFTIVRQIGSGGMGAVYLAEQDRPQRTVALKVIRPDRVTKATRRRFQYEADILGKLQHPGIAKVYAAGEFNLGDGVMPYFAMEYIAEAHSLTGYARTQNLDTKASLELFARVCDAVHYGHQKGIIHRDLKPANILVDNTGAPRIIDFGVARGSDKENVLATMQTNAGQIVGTLQYMSPEQCSGASDNIDVRTDVYALGVVLYELLSGELPYDLSTMGLAEALIVVTQDQAPSLSTNHEQFKGDLAVITAKSLAKDREERYQSAAELAADVRRYLEDRPILARPIGPLGLLRKWIKRNKELATAISLAAAVLTITSAVLITRIVLAEREASSNWLLAEDRLREANENLAATRSTVDVVGDIFQFRATSGESLLDEGKVDIKRLLDTTAERLRVSPPARPGTEADLREILGEGYVAMRTAEAIADAREQLTRVLEIREAERPRNDDEIARAAHNLAATYYWDGQYETALPLYERAVELRRRLFPGDNAEKASSLNNLAATQQKLGKLTDAEALFLEALGMRQRLFGDDNEDVAASYNNVGNLLLSERKYEQAADYLSRSRTLIEKLRGSDSIVTSHATHNLAMCLVQLKQYQQAADLFRQALAIRTARLSPGHANIASSKLGLARALTELGQLDEAETLARESVADLSANLRPNHPDLAWSREVLGRVLIAQGKFADARQTLAVSIESTRTAEPVPEADLADRLCLWAQCLMETHELDAGRAALEESVQLAKAANSPTIAQRATQLLDELSQRIDDDQQASNSGE